MLHLQSESLRRRGVSSAEAKACGGAASLLLKRRLGKAGRSGGFRPSPRRSDPDSRNARTLPDRRRADAPRPFFRAPGPSLSPAHPQRLSPGRPQSGPRPSSQRAHPPATRLACAVSLPARPPLPSWIFRRAVLSQVPGASTPSRRDAPAGQTQPLPLPSWSFHRWSGASVSLPPLCRRLDEGHHQSARRRPCACKPGAASPST